MVKKITTNTKPPVKKQEEANDLRRTTHKKRAPPTLKETPKKNNDALQKFSYCDAAKFLAIFAIYCVCAQFGKTFEMINLCLQRIQADREKQSIHFIYCMNSLLHINQSAHRLRTFEKDNKLNDFEKEFGYGSVVMISSEGKELSHYAQAKNRKADEFVHLKNIQCLIQAYRSYHEKNNEEEEEIFKINPRVILLCSNQYRYYNVIEFLEGIKRTLVFQYEQPIILNSLFDIYIYYDELHSYIEESSITLPSFVTLKSKPKLRDIIQNMIQKYDNIKGILAITATPYKVFQDAIKEGKPSVWNKLTVHAQSSFDDRNYLGFQRVNFVTRFRSEANQPQDIFNPALPESITQIIQQFHLLEDGNRIFIPADVQTASHYAVRRLVRRLSPTAIIIILNSEHKGAMFKNIADESSVSVDSHFAAEEIEVDDGTQKQKETFVNLHSKKTEIAKSIHAFLKDNKRPVVVTGNICIGQGQTLISKELGGFTHAICLREAKTINEGDGVYQLAARVFGRHYTVGMQKPTIYCTEKIKETIITHENRARVCSLLYSGKTITKEQYVKAHTEIVGAEQIAKALRAAQTLQNFIKKESPQTKYSQFFHAVYKQYPDERIRLDYMREFLGNYQALDREFHNIPAHLALERSFKVDIMNVLHNKMTKLLACSTPEFATPEAIKSLQDMLVTLKMSAKDPYSMFAMELIKNL